MRSTGTTIIVILNYIFIVNALQVPSSINVTSNSTSVVTLSPNLSPYAYDQPNTNITNRNNQCKVTFTMSYGYRRYYHWTDSIVEQKSSGNSPSSATLNFRVRAFSDAHILLASSANPAERDPVYEIVIGGGKNSFSDIRRLRKTQTKATATTREILSPYELRGFWIRLSSDGTVEVGREGDDVGFVAWQDPQPLPVRYFGFCTWTGVVGKWEYDCPRNTTNIQEQEEAPEEDNMTFTQRLRRDLLTNYDPYVQPISSTEKSTTVYLHLACQHISLDDNKGIISVMGTMSMHWMDEKLTWKAESYGGLKTLHAASYEIWLPELLLYNAADGAGDAIFNAQNAHVTVSDEGAVMWSPQTQLKALCPLNMAAWPQDRHTCGLQLGVWSHAPTVTLKLMENGTYFDEQQHVTTEWEVVEVSALHIIMLRPWLVPETADDNDEEEYSDSAVPMVSVFNLEVTVQRRSSAYHAILLTPVLWVLISILASFFMSPLSWCRLTVCCLNILFITAFNVGINFRLPVTSDSVPRIISVMSGFYYMATATLIATILSIRLARIKRPYAPPRFITNAINGTLGVFLLLPPYPQIEVNKIYGQLEDLKAVLSDSPHECDQEDELTQTQWFRLATAIDRFLSFIYCITLSIIILM